MRSRLRAWARRARTSAEVRGGGLGLAAVMRLMQFCEGKSYSVRRYTMNAAATCLRLRIVAGSARVFRRRLQSSNSKSLTRAYRASMSALVSYSPRCKRMFPRATRLTTCLTAPSLASAASLDWLGDAGLWSASRRRLIRSMAWFVVPVVDEGRIIRCCLRLRPCAARGRGSAQARSTWARWLVRCRRSARVAWVGISPCGRPLLRLRPSRPIGRTSQPSATR